MHRYLMLALLFSLPACWDFPSERYDLKDSGRDGVATDQKVKVDKKKSGDLPKLKDQAKPKDKRLDTVKPPDQKLPPDQSKPKDLNPDQSKPQDLKPDQPPPLDQMLPPDQGLLLPGSPCTLPTQCLSGKCVDKICCKSHCNMACERCDLAPTAGTCTKVPAGQDPDSDCTADAPSSCAKDGFCDGAGGCRKYQAGTICSPGKCKSGDPVKVILPSICTLQNKCVNLNKNIGETDCKEYRCNPVTPGCYFPCANNTQCASGKTCNTSSGRCDNKPKPLGAICKNKNDCSSGKCVSGTSKVCCDSDCQGTDETCALPGVLGRCVNLKTGL